MKKNLLLLFFILLTLAALTCIAFLFLAEKGANYDFQKQYIIFSGVFLMIVGLLIHIIRVMGQADRNI
jgi:hypothetical protein